MMRKAKFALAFVFGCVYTSAWWVLESVTLPSKDTTFLAIVLFTIAVLIAFFGTLVVVFSTIGAFLEFWQEDLK